MDYRGRRNHRRLPLALAIGLIAASLIVPGPGGTAWALSGTQPLYVIGAPVLGAIALPLIAYGLWINRPANQDKPKKPIPGEFYVSAFAGGSLVSSADWEFREKIVGGPVTASRINYQPGVVGGLKFGYFCDYFPWAGVEVETNFTSNNVRNQQVSLSRPINFTTTATVPATRLYVWTLALHFVARYGFLKDQEVPFGRLQPYVGIGPGLEVVYSWADSGKNFSLEALAGVRYMMLKHVSAFVEYKYGRLWSVELEDQKFRPAGGSLNIGSAHFDFNTHKIVAGVSYHF